MNVKEKIHTVQIHPWISPKQKEKLTTDAKRLGISEVDLIRKNIDRAFVYENQLLPIMKTDKSISDSMNQIAFWCNSEKGLSQKVLEKMEEIRELTWLKYQEIRKFKK